MTKRDYVRIAAAIRQAIDSARQAAERNSDPDTAPLMVAIEAAVAGVTRSIADALEQDNPDFDYRRFLIACGGVTMNIIHLGPDTSCRVCAAVVDFNNENMPAGSQKTIRNAVLRLVTNRRFPVDLVAMEGDRVIGLLESRTPKDTDVVRVLQTVAVAADWRAYGIGTRLLGAMLAIDSTRPIVVHFRNGNLPAERLYRKLGFGDRTLVGKYRLGADDMIRMTREVSP